MFLINSQNYIQPTKAKERLSGLSTLPIKNENTKSFSYKEGIEACTTQKMQEETAIEDSSR